MKKFLLLCAVPALLLGRCTPATMPDMSPDTTSAVAEETTESGYVRANSEYQKGFWLPFTQYSELMAGKNEEEFRKAVAERFGKAVDEGLNTVYLHVRPDGTAYYKSELFPKGGFIDGDYDPLEIMLDEAHKLGLSAHAWINPLRLQTVEQMAEVPENYITKQLIDSGDAGEVNGRYFLHPDSEKVLELLRDSVAEIVENYDVDGVHIDDYFYPTTDTDFDAERFAASGEKDMTKWRTDAITNMVKTLYDAVKAADSDIPFGISPQGNLKADYESQYADVKRWLAEKGYCDYMIPQIYYGFDNETLPFLPTLAEWESLPRDESVSLIIGLGAYKLGKADKWAGAAGEDEWLSDPDIIEKQISAVSDADTDGYAIYY